jgi:hypothetical protein
MTPFQSLSAALTQTGAVGSSISILRNGAMNAASLLPKEDPAAYARIKLKRLYPLIM